MNEPQPRRNPLAGLPEPVELAARHAMVQTGFDVSGWTKKETAGGVNYVLHLVTADGTPAGEYNVFIADL